MDASRKCRWRKQEAERVRKNRVTQTYIEKKYPQIYQEAVEFYKFLDQKYPEKRDLRKTNEFEWIKTGISGETSKKYYGRKKTTRTTTTTTTVIDDRMELVIPLMRKDNTGAPSSQSPAGEPPQTNETPADEQPLGEIVPLGETAIDISPEIPEMMSTLNEEIPEHIIEGIMDELRGDPDFETFFSTISEDFAREELIYQ